MKIADEIMASNDKVGTILKLVKENKDTLKVAMLYSTIGAVALTHLPAVALGACLGIGFWTSRKLTDKVDEKIALHKINNEDAELDKKFG